MVVTLHYYLDVVNCQNQQYIHQRRDMRNHQHISPSPLQTCPTQNPATSDSVATDGKTA